MIMRCALVESFSLTRVSNIPVTWPFSIVGSKAICCFNSDLGVADMMVSPMQTDSTSAVTLYRLVQGYQTAEGTIDDSSIGTHRVSLSPN